MVQLEEAMEKVKWKYGSIDGVGSIGERHKGMQEHGDEVWLI